MRLSERGAAFIARHEGFVGHAYRDPVGVLTIGFGFTMRSAVFARRWRQLHGRDLAPGDRIARDEARALLRELVDREYGAAVTSALGPMPQHRHDACCSAVFNLGPRALSWRWARALREGDVARAATILAGNYNTAGGRRLGGLVRRREEEARLLRTGDYGDGRPPAVAAAERDNTRDDATAKGGALAWLMALFGRLLAH
jgi:GH24 family phage-related lysozyme (muramidase)